MECNPSRIARRIEYGNIGVQAADVDDALRQAAGRDSRRPLSISLLLNTADAMPRLLAMGAPVDVVTDQTSAHLPRAYLPTEVAIQDWAGLRPVQA